MDVLTIIAGTLLAALLGAIAVVDWQSLKIPNRLNLALFGSGMVVWLVEQAAWPPVPLLSALATYAVLVALRWAHSLYAGRIGLGLGDVKMLAASTAWIVPFNLPLVVLIASSAALLYCAGLAVSGATLDGLRVPFGPFIAIGLLSTWIMQRTNLLTGWGAL